MKKIIIFNLLFCILVIFVSIYFFNAKSNKAVAYYYAENYIETNYSIDRENLELENINYFRGMGFFEIEVKNVATKDYYFFEVDLKDDYSLNFINDHTDLYNENRADRK